MNDFASLWRADRRSKTALTASPFCGNQGDRRFADFFDNVLLSRVSFAIRMALDEFVKRIRKGLFLCREMAKASDITV